MQHIEPSKIGKKFSFNYGDHTASRDDSVRARARLREYILWLLSGTNSSNLIFDFIVKLRIKFGLKIEQDRWRSGISNFYDNADIRDLLDSITFLFNLLKAGYYDNIGFINSVRDIFVEEKLNYLIDDMGGVHYSVDSEFSHNQEVTVSAISTRRYETALAEFQASKHALIRKPPDRKEAIRRIFGSAENVFRILFPKASRLGGIEADQHLKPLVELRYQDPAGRGAANKQLQGFKQWIDSAHFYRHEQGNEEPIDPPLDLAVLLISLGTSYIRWLVEFDEAKNKS